MNTILRRSGRTIEADVIAFDGENRPILLVEVKARANASEDRVFRYLSAFLASEFPFGMFADFSQILIFCKDLDDPRTPIRSLKTRDILSRYEPEFGEKRIFHDYFETLIEAWLRDFAFHWKSENPPAFEEMEAIGLGQRLLGGMTYKGVHF